MSQTEALLDAHLSISEHDPETAAALSLVHYSIVKGAAPFRIIEGADGKIIVQMSAAWIMRRGRAFIKEALHDVARQVMALYRERLP